MRMGMLRAGMSSETLSGDENQFVRGPPPQNACGWGSAEDSTRCDGSGWVSDSDGPFTKGLMLTSSDVFYLRPGKGKTNLVILPSSV